MDCVSFFFIFSVFDFFSRDSLDSKFVLSALSAENFVKELYLNQIGHNSCCKKSLSIFREMLRKTRKSKNCIAKFEKQETIVSKN